MLNSDFPLISVVVCTYNRAYLLPTVLESLRTQTLDGAQYEVIVVDNNSQDSTRQVAEIFCNNFNNFRYYFEPEQGLSHARNRGWRKARGEYVAYVDDECRLPREWLTVAKEIIEKFQPAAFGGPIRPLYQGERPKWFRHDSHEPYTEGKILEGREFATIHGGNAFFMRQVLSDQGGFDPDLGMRGDKIGFAEETILLKTISEQVPRCLYFDPRLYVYHVVLPYKMTWRYRIRGSFAAGRQFYLSGFQRRPLHYKFPKLLRHMIVTIFRMGVDLARALVGRDRQQYPYIQNYLNDHTLLYLRELGGLYEQCRGRKHHGINQRVDA